MTRLLSHARLEGEENLPGPGAYIYVGNHMAAADIPLVYTYFGHMEMSSWAAEKYRRHPIFNPLIRMGGAVYVERGEVDRAALKHALDWLESGKPFALSPEGTRSTTGKLLRGKTGAAYLAAEADVPVVPVGLIGTDRARHELMRLRRPKLVLRIGEMFRLPPLDPENRSRSLRENTDEIMCRIAALLPERYWGYYADYPRVRELQRLHTFDSAL